jgi:signal transduction histidine kinase/CheY-like chemotaxis protein
MTWPIVAVRIETENDVVSARQRALRIAELLGFDRQGQTRIATAVSEIARNAFRYAGKGRAEFMIDPDTTPQMLRVRISDSGRGIDDLQTILDGRYRSSSGMGLGIIGARRLMEHFRINSDPKNGTVVDLGQALPKSAARIAQSKLSEIADALKREMPDDPLAALREQHREILETLTELRRLQDESRQLNDELEDTNRGVVALYAELDERAEQLRKASELKSRFLSNMSHEFRTPLNSVLALSKLLLDRIDGELTPEQERQVGYISRSAEGMLELVNDLLDLSKVEAGKADVRSERFKVQALFGALRGALRPLRTTPSVELIFDVADNVPDLVTDESKVAQILRNLISNALKFTESGEVYVAARYEQEERLVVFSVRDTGIGIAPEDQSRIFEEFSQISTPLHKKVKGTGLGLPLSRSLAELIGGTITVESVLGQGSVFSLVIPAFFAPAQAASPAEASTSEDVRKQVLVIDDDETFRYVIRKIISHEPVYDVIEASGGAEGLRRARDDRPNAIILDLQMPEVDGFAVLRELGTDERTSLIPVIVATSLPIDADLKARLPEGTTLVSKDIITREKVTEFLRDATSMQGM